MDKDLSRRNTNLSGSHGSPDPANISAGRRCLGCNKRTKLIRINRKIDRVTTRIQFCFECMHYYKGMNIVKNRFFLLSDYIKKMIEKKIDIDTINNIISVVRRTGGASDKKDIKHH